MSKQTDNEKAGKGRDLIYKDEREKESREEERRKLRGQRKDEK